MSFLRTDGDVEIFVLQTRSEKYRDGQWFNASLDYFGTPDGFSPSGICWQATGMNGTFSRTEGLAGLSWIATKHPGREFRLVKVRCIQTTEEISILKLN